MAGLAGGLADNGGPSAAVVNESSLVWPLGAPSGDATGAADVAAINAALAAVSTAGGGIVQARSGVTYQIGIVGTKTVQNPSGSTGPKSYCVEVPSNCILDMNGSTLQLRGSTEAMLVSSKHLDNSVRDHDLGLRNAILDGRNIVSTATVMLQFSSVDRLVLNNVKPINGVYVGGWIFAADNCYFDNLDSDGIQGQAWQLGDPQTGGAVSNLIYRSQFGLLRGRNTTLLNTGSQPGNPYYFAIQSCTIDSINVYNCQAGVKVGQPSSDVEIGSVLVDTCGEATALNSGFKIQGDGSGTYAPPTDRPTRIVVGRVVAKNCQNIGLYVIHSQDCTVQAYRGYNNCLHDASSAHTDIYTAGNNNFRLGDAHSYKSQAAGLRVSDDSWSNAESGSRIQTLKVTDAGQNASAAIRDGVRIDGASVIDFGKVDVVDDQGGSPTTQIAFNINNAAAVGKIDDYIASGQVGSEFTTNASLFRYPGIDALAPSAAKAQTYQRAGRALASVAMGTTGVLNLFAIELKKGQIVSNITFETGSTGATGPTHWWFSLHDSARVMLAVTADQLTAAWGGTTRKTLAIATTAAGAASSFTATYSGLHYLGILVAVSTTMPNLDGVGLATVVGGDPPIVAGTADGSLTGPPAFPFTAIALTALALHPYAYVS